MKGKQCAFFTAGYSWRRAMGLTMSLILGLVATHAAFADETVTSSGVRADGVPAADQLLLSGVYAPALFPELDYSMHPARLSLLSRSSLVVDIAFLHDYNWETSERLDDEIGATGGIRRKQDYVQDGALDLEWYSVLDAGVAGGGIAASGERFHYLTERNDYEAFTQNSLQETRYLPYSLGGNAVWASAGSALRQGYVLGYDYAHEPAWFTWVTDETQDPVLKYVADTGSHADAYAHSAMARGDWGTALGNIDIAVSAGYDFSFIDRNTQYRAVDTSGDNLADTVMTWTEWSQTAAEDGGPAGDVKGFSQEDSERGHRVDLNATMRVELTERLELMLSGNYIPLDYRERRWHTRLTTDTNPEDDSWESRTYSQDWGNFTAGGVLSTDSEYLNSGVRFGAHYSRNTRTLMLDGVQASGQRLYHRDNSGHYSEVDLGENPARGEVVSSAGDPAYEVEQRVTVLGGLHWPVSDKLQLFSTLELSGSHGQGYYRVFNRFTNTVWEEVRGSQMLNWSLLPRLGAVLPITDAITWVGDIAAVQVPGRYGRTLHEAPYDVSVGRITGDGSTDLNQSGGVGLSINFRFVLQP